MSFSPDPAEEEVICASTATLPGELAGVTKNNEDRWCAGSVSTLLRWCPTSSMHTVFSATAEDITATLQADSDMTPPTLYYYADNKSDSAFPLPQQVRKDYGTIQRADPEAQSVHVFNMQGNTFFSVGSTASIVVDTGRDLVVSYVGDSPVFMLMEETGDVQCLTPQMHGISDHPDAKPPEGVGLILQQDLTFTALAKDDSIKLVEASLYQLDKPDIRAAAAISGVSIAEEIWAIGRSNILIQSGRLGGRLNMTKSFGDLALCTQGLTATPDVATYPRHRGLVLVMSDGVADALVPPDAPDQLAQVATELKRILPALQAICQYRHASMTDFLNAIAREVGIDPTVLEDKHSVLWQKALKSTIETDSIATALILYAQFFAAKMRPEVSKTKDDTYIDDTSVATLLVGRSTLFEIDCVGIFDGHGGKECAQHLEDHYISRLSAKAIDCLITAINSHDTTRLIPDLSAADLPARRHWTPVQMADLTEEGREWLKTTYPAVSEWCDALVVRAEPEYAGLKWDEAEASSSDFSLTP